MMAWRLLEREVNLRKGAKTTGVCSLRDAWTGAPETIGEELSTNGFERGRRMLSIRKAFAGSGKTEIRQNQRLGANPWIRGTGQTERADFGQGTVRKNSREEHEAQERRGRRQGQTTRNVLGDMKVGGSGVPRSGVAIDGEDLGHRKARKAPMMEFRKRISIEDGSENGILVPLQRSKGADQGWTSKLMIVRKFTRQVANGV
jgi:hypothetical protein